MNKFIDLEAQEDSGEEYESDGIEDEEEDRDGVILDGEQELEMSSERTLKRSRIETFDEPRNVKRVQLDAFIHNLTERYAGGVQTQEVPVHYPVQAAIERSNRSDDWPLWRVKCSCDEEYYVLYQLMSKHEFLSKELRSAFFNPQSPGTIYLEAHFCREDHVASLYHTLWTLSSIKIKTLVAVPENKAAACLSIRHSPNDNVASPGEWVTVKRGLYKGDVGLVVDTFERWGGMRGSEVALVPRLSGDNSPRKRKKSSSSFHQRPPPLLFNPKHCIQDALRTTDTGYTFNHLTFESGLILKNFHSSNLAPAQMMPSQLLPFFRQSKHPLIRSTTMPIPEQWRFEVGEKILASPLNREAPIPGTILEMNGSMGRSFVVDTAEGHQLFSPLCFSKDINPGDFVEILTGEHAGQTGFVVSRNGSLLSMAPGRFGVEPDIWAHVNSVKLTVPPVAPVIAEPWIDIEVSLKSGAYADMRGIIKHVRPDGRGSVRLAVYVPKIFRTLDVDIFMIAELKTDKLLFEFQPLMFHQQRFRVLPELKAMRTGQIPWVGMKVDVVAGEYKGQRGLVRDVNRYRPNLQTPRKQSGLTLTLERLVMTASSSNALIKLDYDEVRYHKTSFKLAELFWPSERQSYYHPLTTTESSNKVFPVPDTDSNTGSNTPMPTDPGSQTPMPTEFELAHIFTGAWSPGARTPIPGLDETPLGLDETPVPLSLTADPSALGSHEAEGPSSHWILNPSLLGIAIRVDIQGGPFDTMRKPKSHGTFIETVVESDRIIPTAIILDKRSPVAVDQILKFRNRPKPTSERSLMVVIEGPHTGKYVRQVYHFFQGAQSEENAKFIAMVMDRSEQVERALDEILELDRNEVELVQERADERKYMNGVLKDIRDGWRTGRPEIRI